jgi:ubiquinone/menaquinone biosynthesis C-methylase UbiE
MDAATFFFVFHHIDENRHDQVMNEMKRVLKPDGRIFIAEDLVDSEEERQLVEKIDRRVNFETSNEVPHHYKNTEEWISFFSAHGFEVERTHEEKPEKVRHGFFVLKKVPETEAK